jgi:hypothetical protein
MSFPFGSAASTNQSFVQTSSGAGARPGPAPARVEGRRLKGTPRSGRNQGYGLRPDAVLGVSVRTGPTVWRLTVGAAVVSAACLWMLRPLGQPEHHLPFAALVALFAAAEVAVARLDFGPFGLVWSPIEVPVVLGLIGVRPLLLVAAWELASVAALAGIRRLRPVQLAYNLAVFPLAGAAAVVVARIAPPPQRLDRVVTLAALLGAAVAAWIVCALAAALAGQVTGASRGAAPVRSAAAGLLASGATASLTLVGVALWRTQPSVLAFLAVPVVTGGSALALLGARRRGGGLIRPAPRPLPGRDALFAHVDRLVEAGEAERSACVFVTLTPPAEPGAAGIDARLVAVAAQRVQRGLREGDAAFRFDPQVLAVVARVRPERGTAEAEAMAGRLLSVLRRPAAVGGREVILSAAAAAVALADITGGVALAELGARAVSAARQAPGEVVVLAGSEIPAAGPGGLPAP